MLFDSSIVERHLVTVTCVEGVDQRFHPDCDHPERSFPWRLPKVGEISECDEELIVIGGCVASGVGTGINAYDGEGASFLIGDAGKPFLLRQFRSLCGVIGRV